MEDYSVALEQQTSDDVVERMIAFHSSRVDSETTSHFTFADLKKLTNHLCETFNNFASFQAGFHRLNMCDQFKLLVVNRPLFVHFVLAKYLAAKTA